MKDNRFNSTLKNKIGSFMSGRNGLDPLNIGMFALGVASGVIYGITKVRVFNAFYYVMFALFLYRSLSRDLARRRNENAWFLSWISFFKAWWNGHKEFKIYRCRCGRTIRIPRHHGDVEATCPTCGRKKILYTGKKPE